jgi:Fe-S oxidoreductase
LLQEWLAQRHLVRVPALADARFRLLPHCTEMALAADAVNDWKLVFAGLGASLEVMPAGCCGMAGTYGHERRNAAMSEHIFDLSWRRHLQSPGTLLATGYSCRSQVKRFGNVTLAHPAQALLAALTSPATPLFSDRA